MKIRLITVLVAAGAVLMLPTAIEAKKEKSCLDCIEPSDDNCQATCTVNCLTCPRSEMSWILDKCEKYCAKMKTEKKPANCKCDEYDKACMAKCTKATPKPTTKVPKPTAKAPKPIAKAPRPTTTAPKPTTKPTPKATTLARRPTPVKTSSPDSLSATVLAPDYQYRNLRA